MQKNKNPLARAEEAPRAILELDREQEFRLPGDDKGPTLVVVRARGSDAMWATAASLAPWLGYSDARAVRAQIRNCGSMIAEYVAGIASIPAGGAVPVARTVAVYSEGAWDLLAERGRTERAKAIKALFKRAIADELRLMRAAAKGPIPYGRAVLALALKRLRPVAEDQREGTVARDYLSGVVERLEEDRTLGKHAASDPLALEASLARIAHAPPRGEALPDYARSVAATERAFRNRSKGE